MSEQSRTLRTSHQGKNERPLCERDASKCLTMCPHECVSTCPTHAFSLIDGSSILFCQEKCIGCGRCINQCPGGALSIDGRSNPNALQREESNPTQRVSLKKQVLARRKAAHR